MARRFRDSLSCSWDCRCNGIAELDTGFALGEASGWAPRPLPNCVIPQEPTKVVVVALRTSQLPMEPKRIWLDV
eukprot:1114398-Pyramimonas_sp.AAC.1